MGLPDLGLEPPTCELSLDKWMLQVFHCGNMTVTHIPVFTLSFTFFFLLSMQYSFCSLRICGTPSALPDAAKGHFRLLVLPLAEKKNHLDPLTSKAVEGKGTKEFLLGTFFFF